MMIRLLVVFMLMAGVLAIAFFYLILAILWIVDCLLSFIGDVIEADSEALE